MAVRSPGNDILLHLGSELYYSFCNYETRDEEDV